MVQRHGVTIKINFCFGICKAQNKIVRHKSFTIHFNLLVGRILLLISNK